jgi:hypothetical protein
MHRCNLIAAALVAGTLAGARIEAQSARVGVYLGSSIATIADDADPIVEGLVGSVSRNRRVGLQGGLWLNRPLSGAFSLQPELHFTHKGLGVSGRIGEPGEPPLDVEAAVNLSYLELPLLLRADVGQADGSVRPFVVAGPVLSYQIGCSIAGSVAGFSQSQDCDEGLDVEDQINKLDVGASVGGGLGVTLSGRDVTAGLRYTHGLRSLSKTGDGVTNRNFSLLFGIAF